MGDLEATTGLDATAISAALAGLAASGLLGVDLADGGYFHRELPFDLEATDRRQPRLRDARRIVSADGVRIESSGDEELVAWVAGSGVEHRVRMSANGATCTCPWFGRHQGARGPCRHVLAVQLATMGRADPGRANDVADA
jgi:predicted nucleic acid-binding Zn finger protein